MDVADRAQRVIGLEAIKAKAENLAAEGKDPFEIRAFVKGARGELAKQKPDWQKYAAAVKASKEARGTF
jgi:hypothetical protein